MKLAIGLPSYRPVDTRVDLARMRLGSELALAGVAWEAIAVTQQPWLGNALDTIMHRFLASDCDRLLVLDDDIVFEPRDAMHLANLSDDAIGGDYALKAVGAGMLCRPLDADASGPLVECTFLGLGFCAFSRKLIADVAERSQPFIADERSADAGQICRSLFAPVFASGRRVDGDVAFFLRAREAGYRLLCDRSIHLGHVGAHVYTDPS